MDNLVIALDFKNQDEVETFLDRFDEPLFVKVGMELYYQCGPKIIEVIKQRGHRIFLDLKLHDIPNTVEAAMRGLAKLDIDMINVHAAGGSEMMKAALRGLKNGTPEGHPCPKLIAVTQLTSVNDAMLKLEQNVSVSLMDSVVHYAKLAQSCGLDGVVCSALEASAIQAACGHEFLKVTPGIRMNDGSVDDQKRVTTPSQARHYGATHIVVGRPITQAEDCVEAYRKILLNWEEV